MKRVVLLALFFWAVPIKSQKTTITPREAVCIIGSHSIYTESSREQLENIATLLESKNYKVHRFYDPNNEWEAIKKTAVNASIFIYRGHGTNMGIDGGFGGIVVDEHVSGKEISTNLTFNLSPLVIFISACGGAGSSAGDDHDIGVAEAKTRVLGSALPFLLAGAQGYYANNYENGAYNFLQQWTEQQTLETCYTNSIYSWCTVQANESVDDERITPAFNIAISSSPDNSVHTLSTTTNGITTIKKINRKFDYSIAYLGNPQLTLAQTLKKKSLYAKN
ncbi:MAG: hypothetical protein ACKO4Y_00400 [Flavobacteriales bacterium]